MAPVGKRLPLAFGQPVVPEIASRPKERREGRPVDSGMPPERFNKGQFRSRRCVATNAPTRQAVLPFD